MDTARRIEDDLRHAPVLEAVADAVERLLSASDWRPAAAAALERLGSAAGASRAYLIENHIDERGMLVGSTQHAWSSTVGGQPPSDVEDERAWQGALKRWAGLHAMGSVVVADVANLPEDERVELESRGVCSVAEYPILTGAAWWGVIGFEDHERDRSWRNELEALRTIASVIGAVVARDRATEEQRRTERRWQQVIEHIPAITYTDLVVAPGQVRMGFVSPQIQTVLGYEPQRFLEDPKLWLSLVHPDDLARLEASGVLEPSDTSAFDEIYRMRAADGSYRWLHDTSTPVLNDHGEFDHFLGFAIDVTERMQAQEFVRQAEERYRLLVERTPVITYTEDIAEVYDPEATVSYVSPQITAVLGYDAKDWQVPGFWMHVVHPDDRDAVTAESVRTNLTGEPYRQEYRMIATDGRIVWFQDESIVVRDDEGEPVCWQGVMMDITERKITEQQLRMAEERFRTLVEHLPAVVYAAPINGDMSLRYTSPQVERLLGWSAEEWQSHAGFWLDHVHPDDRNAVAAADVESDATMRPFTAEYRIRHKDGHDVWVHDEAVIVVDDDGSPLFWQGVMLDVTPQHEAKRGLDQAEERYRGLVEHIPAVVYRESPSGDPAKFYVSPQVLDLFGYAPEQWTWEPDFWRRRVHPDDRAVVFRTDHRSNASKEPYSLDYRFRHADGRWVWIHDEATFMADADDDEGGYWQGFLVDITDRRTAEDQVREAEAKFRTIVEQNQAVFYTQEIDPDDPTISRTTYIAPGNTDLVGYTLEDIEADPTLWRSMVHPLDRDRVLAADSESNRNGEGRFSMEYRMVAKDGRIVWVQDEARLVTLPGKPPYWQGFLLDVTERKQAQAQLERALAVERKATQRLRSLDEMKNTFLQAVSHDLRTPLAAILGLAVTLERDDVVLDEGDARDLAHRIAGNARRLDRLVANLLDMDRLARGIVTPSLELTDVGALVGRIVEESELVPAERLETSLEPIVARVDVAKVERMVENLLANAARHAPATSTIWVRVASELGGIVIAVEDDGPGVPQALREVVFEPFRQGADAPLHSPGVGVGLALVRRFAELLGGRAWVQEREGGGASFRVLLPARSSEA